MIKWTCTKNYTELLLNKHKKGSVAQSLLHEEALIVCK